MSRRTLPRPVALVPQQGLAADCTVRRGSLALHLELRVDPGQTLALVGPNGAGKSTALAALAGLVPLSRGRITLAGRALEGRAPEDRGVGLMFQDDLLFPHLDLTDNVAYGLRARGLGRKEARARARAWLERVGLAAYLDARPDAVSGGQRQRAALARALITEPRMLLLDEPLAAVDAQARIALRRLLREELARFPGVRILVAHDPVDAFALADRVAVLEDGRVTQTGSVAELTSRPRSPWVADLLGINLLRGTVRDGVLHLADLDAGHPGSTAPEAAAAAEAHDAPAPGAAARPALTTAGGVDGPALATIHPRAIALFPDRPAGSPRNVWQAPVETIERTGDRLRIRFAGPLPLVAEVTPAARDELALEPGRAVWLAVKATEIAVYPA